ncbi:MAG: zinc ribbon domain-containing protein [Promethearchaeota archaeon]
MIPCIPSQEEYEMLLCLNCGTDNPEGSVYCFNCGSILTKKIDSAEVIICINSGKSNPLVAQFCRNCDHYLGEISKYQKKPAKQLIEYYPTLSVQSIVKNGFNYLQKHPRLLIITLCFLLLDLFFVQTNESLRNSFLFTSSPYYYPTYYYLPLIESFIIFMVRFLIQCFAISWLLTSFKQIRIQRSETTLNLLKSLCNSIKFLPKITVVNFLTLVII